MQSQQQQWQQPTRELSTVSKQQPGTLPRTSPAGIEAGLAAVLLAALTFAMVVGYVAASALTTRDGYTKMNLLREIEDLRSETALLRYQAYLAESELNVEETATDLGMQPAHPVSDVDYVLLPCPDAGAHETQIASGAHVEGRRTLAVRLADYALEVVSLGGRAEASTVSGQRR